MIIHLKSSVSESEASRLAEELNGVQLSTSEGNRIITGSTHKELHDKYSEFVDQFHVSETDIQLSSLSYRKKVKNIAIGNTVLDDQHTIIISGPCAVESEEQIEASAKFISSLGLTALRAGSYKPRTSPYSFQGLGLEGLKLLDKIRAKYGLSIVTEVRDATHVDDVIAFADVIQVGAKAMYDHGILKKCGRANKPVLLKRGFGTTIQEFCQMAEFVLLGGNEQVILCERGIRTFENKSRFTLDLCGVAYLKEHVNLPIVLDPSHAMGYAYGVPDLAKACCAMGVDGLLIEVHPSPSEALSDARQQLNHEQFEKLLPQLRAVSTAVNRTIC